MKCEIFKTEHFKEGVCHLSAATLKDYIISLPLDANDYEIQREIVRNVYLDSLADTLFEKQHIPLIVLISDDVEIDATKQSMTVRTFKVLDGLQRTTRLQALYSAACEKLSHVETNYSPSTTLKNIENSGTVGAEIVKQARLQIEKRLQAGVNINTLIEAFNRIQWFEIWSNLSYEQRIRKMLLLNAGHKPVTSRHQLELLFLNWLPRIRELSNERITVIREKECPSIRFAKTRVSGQFHFSHLIAGMLALGRGIPLITNADLIKDIQEAGGNDEYMKEVTSEGFIANLVELLLTIDSKAEEEKTENDTTYKWAGREVVVVGTLAAIGAYANENKIPKTNALVHSIKAIRSLKSFSLTEFEAQRNNLDLAKINIGNVNKKAIFHAMLDVLNGAQNITWNKYFISGAR